MESVSHSRQPNRSAPTLSKKACNGSNFAAKTTYDDVFGGPPKFGAPTLSPRVEDYSEIFGGFHASRASSIPILDLPVVDEAEVFFDVRSSSFDYSEVFGGFNGLDFAISYEELLNQSKGGDGDSSEEAWTPAETESLSEESDHSGKNQRLSNGDSYESIDGSTEFSVLYHKTNQSVEDVSNGITHVAQLHAVPGYTFVVDKSTPLQMTDDENPALQVTDDSCLDLDLTGGIVKGRHLKKTMSHPSNGITGGWTLENDVKPQKGYCIYGSHPNEMFVTVSEINLRTQPSELPPPSRAPPASDVKNGDSIKLTSNCKNVTSDGTAGDISPPFFDVEVDASSSAAASAAAIKEAMEKAHAKLKSAKALMERKREGFQSHTKRGSRNDKKDTEGSVSKNVDGSSGMKDERVHGTCEREDNGIKFSVREEKQKVVKTTQAVPDLLEGENLSYVAKQFAEERHGKESWTSQGSVSNKIDGVGEWKEATQFFELVRTDKSRKASEQANNEKISVQNTKTYERGQKERKQSMGALEQQQENGKKVKSVREDHELEECDKKLKVAKEACEREGNNGRSEAAKEARKHKGHEKKVKVSQEACERKENEKKSRMARQRVETGKKPTGADDSEKHENLVEVQRKENKFEVEQAMKYREVEQRSKEANRSMEKEKRVEESREREDNEKRQREAFEREQNEKKLKQSSLEWVKDGKMPKEALDQEEKEKRLKEVLEQEENEKKQKEACEREENEKRLQEALKKIENENEWRLKEAIDQEENEKKQREAREREEDEKRQKVALMQEEEEKKKKEAREREEIEKRLNEACEKEENKKRLKGAHEKEEIEKILEEACEQEDNGKTLKQAQGKEESETRLKAAFEQGEIWNTSKEARNWEETEKMLKNAGMSEELKGLKKAHEQAKRDENRKQLKMAEGTHGLRVSDEACKHDDTEKLEETLLTKKHEENSTILGATQEAITHAENQKIRTESKDREKNLEAVDMVYVQDDGKFEVSGMAEGNLEHEEDRFRVDDVAESLCQDNSVKKAGDAGTGTGQKDVGKIKSTSKMNRDNENQASKYASECGERGKNFKQAQVALSQEESKDKLLSTQAVKESVETGRKMGAALPSMLKEKENTQKPAQRVNASQSAERKERNLNETLKSEEKEAERMGTERELEKEHLRKMEEEREREREREKDRMAVDRAALEARDRAYAEVRERAERAAVERATAEARQRAMTDARERLEKACAEAREKSLADKASMEARLRAERAAVDRATAEVRERAVEKAMAERAAFEARERVERSFSDKFSASSRNSGMRPSSSSSDIQDQQFQSAGSSIGSRYPYSSLYGASYYSDRSEGVEGESAQRYKARLERHQRTAERAAKALAEKNMRDLLAQREQAERNRLAETLDADVKRWSSGKEGNLRALLSTLQYILGPECGWQPIPLTEVITAAAVKKAYRKATLCVHPDKLQQRGASIQQKYICEKVFDLLKEAWNRFNSEER